MLSRKLLQKAVAELRGAVRVIYLYVIRAEEVVLIAVVAKNEREDLTSDQKNQINRFVEDYKAAGV